VPNLTSDDAREESGRFCTGSPGGETDPVERRDAGRSLADRGKAAIPSRGSLTPTSSDRRTTIRGGLSSLSNCCDDAINSDANALSPLAEKDEMLTDRMEFAKICSSFWKSGTVS
jgi:hypothetical protein